MSPRAALQRAGWMPLLALALVLAPTAAKAQDFSKTLFLVSRPGMPDRNFRDTVVLVSQDENAQAIGVILNRPTDRSLSEVLPGERFKRFTDPVYFGGPVQANGLFAVFRAEKSPGAALALLPGLHLALHPDTIDALIKAPPASLRFFTGYSGWAPDQLRGEIERGDWYIVDADADTVFSKDLSRLWQNMLRRARAVRADAGSLPSASR